MNATATTPLDRSHSFKWRVCPVCNQKVESHKESAEFWAGPRKQLAHRKKCATRLRLYLELGGTISDHTPPPPTLAGLKRQIRAETSLSGHHLGRFADSDPEHGKPYAIARCAGCYAPVVVSPTRYGTRYAGGRALDPEACPSPYTPEPGWLLDMAASDGAPAAPALPERSIEIEAEFPAEGTEDDAS
jgi:hypothetical protein